MTRVRRVLRREPVAIALTAYDIWSRLPKRQRQAMLQLARKHGPALARKHGPAILARAMSTKKR
jgi:hypothetical protein